MTDILLQYSTKLSQLTHQGGNGYDWFEQEIQ